MDSTIKREVAILQESLEAYRSRFLEALHEALASHGIGLAVYSYADGIPANLRAAPYVRPLKSLGRGRLRWARLPREVREADLVIQPQQVRHLSFLWLLLLRRWRGRRNAFWGHGRCFDPGFEKRLSERVKRWFSTRVDWWFAYNDLSARIVADLGFAKERITSVMNSTDTAALRKRLAGVQEEGLETWRQRLGIGPGPVGAFLGRLYFNKRIDFTLEAAMAIRQRIPTFELIVIGDGEDRWMVEQAAARHPWIHYAGHKGDTEKVPWLALADVLLNPGVVGLVINDAMALGLPTITTDFPTHSPEIDYLQEGVNGLISRPWQDLTAFVDATVELLDDPPRLARMRAAALDHGALFSAEVMAQRFAVGIAAVLTSIPPRFFSSLGHESSQTRAS